MKQFQPIEEYETAKFLQRVAAKPEDLSEHVRRYVLPFARDYLF